MSGFEKTLFVLNLSLVTWFVLAILPISVRMLSQTQSRLNIDALVNSLTESTLGDFLTRRAIYLGDGKVEEGDGEAVRNVLEVGLASIKEFDALTFELLMSSLRKKFEELLSETKSNDLRTTVRANFREMANELFHFAVVSKNEAAALSVLRIKYQMEYYVITHHAEYCTNAEGIVIPTAYDDYLYTYDLEGQFNRAIQANEDNVCGEIIDHVRDHLTLLIREYYPTHELFNYQKPTAAQETVNFGVISRLIESLARSCKTAKRINLFNRVNNLFHTVIPHIAESKLSVDSKTYMTRVFASLSIKVLSLECELNDSTMRYPLVSWTFSEHIKTKLLPKECLQTLLRQYEILLNNNQLSGPALNSMRSAASHLLHNHATEPAYYEGLIAFIVNKFDRLRSIITADDDLRRKDNYVRLIEQLRVLKTEVQDSPASINLMYLIENVMRKFRHEAQFRIDLYSAGYVRDEEII